jgi:2-aminoadipate transaminase
MEKFLVSKQTSDMHVCALTQRIVSEYLDQIDFYERIGELIAFYDHRKEKMIEALDAYMPEGVVYEKPQGGLFVWLDLPDYIDSTNLFLEGLKHNIGIIPGIMFFADQTEEVNHYLRLCFSQVNDEDMDQGIRILGDLLSKHIDGESYKQVV